jgi:hypothetical protein
MSTTQHRWSQASLDLALEITALCGYRLRADEAGLWDIMKMKRATAIHPVDAIHGLIPGGSLRSPEHEAEADS